MRFVKSASPFLSLQMILARPEKPSMAKDETLSLSAGFPALKENDESMLFCARI
jgi:hypothetical protein